MGNGIPAAGAAAAAATVIAFTLVLSFAPTCCLRCLLL